MSVAPGDAGGLGGADGRGDPGGPGDPGGRDNLDGPGDLGGRDNLDGPGDLGGPAEAVEGVREPVARSGAQERLASRLRRARILRRAKGDVQIDRSARIGAKVHVEVDRGAQLIVGPDCWIGDHVRIFVRAGTVELRAGAILRERSSVVGVARVLVGEHVDVGERAAIIDLEPGLADVETPLREQAVLARGIEIGDGAVIAPAAVIETGARVPKRGRLAAGVTLARLR